MGHHVNIAERRISQDGEVSDIDEIGMGDTQCSKSKEQQGVQPREKVIQSRSGVHRDHSSILSSKTGVAGPMSGHRPDFDPSRGFVVSLL